MRIIDGAAAAAVAVRVVVDAVGRQRRLRRRVADIFSAHRLSRVGKPRFNDLKSGRLEY